MIYYSHSQTSEDGITTGRKLLRVHTNGVLNNALKHWYEGVDFGVPNEKILVLLETIVSLHDLGKYTPYFQNYLLRREPIDYELKKHASFGSIPVYNYWLSLEPDEPKFAVIAMLLIYRHHGYLIPLDELVKKVSDENNAVRFEKQLESIVPFIDVISAEVSLDKINKFLVYPDLKTLRRAVKFWIKKNTNIRDYFLGNYLFSLLIEGDKLDASGSSVYNRKAIDPSLVDKRFGIPSIDSHQELSGLNQNDIRNYCRAEVVNHLNNDSILNHYIFTLTAPTGIGKTMTALDFALKLKAKIKKHEKHDAQIIYALPFINIIEQGLREYETTLQGSDARILGHYQFADVFGKQNDSDEDEYHQKLMKLDTWQSDIVITSFVQFFETLICNRNKLLKKFNHYAGSIIILDEVQTLRLDYLPLIGATLHFLAKFLKSRVVLMTATKPKIFDLAQSEILGQANEQSSAIELLSSHNKIFALFNRTAVHPILNAINPEFDDLNQQFCNNIFTQHWEKSKSCIIVCNTVKRSIALFDLIKEHVEGNGLENPVFYLSTNIIPIQRLQRINEIADALKEGLSPILIATQVVEAGVDLDFDMGFRDLGPIDSIVQVAGRINRHNDPLRKGAPLYIVDFNECDKIYGKLTTIQAKIALNKHKVIPENNYLTLINNYFEGISDKKSFHISRSFFSSMKTLKYDSDDRSEYPVSAFRIIEQSGNYQSVFVEINENSRLLREKYFDKIVQNIDREEFDKLHKRNFQQHILSVPQQFTIGLNSINQFEENILFIPLELLSSYYSLDTGMIRDVNNDSVTLL